MFSHNRRKRNALRSPMQLERLEQRLPLAGNVTAELTGSTLRLAGDNLANDVLVASAADGKIAVIGIDTTINGGTGAFVSSKAVTSIVGNFNGGDDAVGFGNSAADYASQRQSALQFTSTAALSDEQLPPAPFDVAALQARIDEVAGGVTTFSIPGGLTVTTGDGNDSVGISGSLGGSVNGNLGSADVGNAILIGSDVPASRVGGGVTVIGGDRNDALTLGNVSVAGTVSASLGDGTNQMFVAGEAATPSNIGALAYTGGVNQDIVALAGDVIVRNNARIFTGVRGEDVVAFSDDGGPVKVKVQVLGNVVVNTGTGNDGDTVQLIGDVRGDVSVTTGGGRDAVLVSPTVDWFSTDATDPAATVDGAGPSAIGRGLTINTGAENDLIAIAKTTVGRNVRIDAGSGDDSVQTDGMQVRRTLLIYLGAGDDSLAVTKLRAFAAFVYGGYGTNSLSMDTGTGAASRTLRHYQFEAVTNS